MAPAELDESSLAGFTDDFETMEEFRQPGASPASRDDLSLCFLCLRWTSGDPGCRSGSRCEYQLVLDQLDGTS